LREASSPLREASGVTPGFSAKGAGKKRGGAGDGKIFDEDFFTGPQRIRNAFKQFFH